MNDLEVLKIRKKLGLTQDKFAKLIGVDRRTVINYEQGKIIPDAQQKLIKLIYEQQKKPGNFVNEAEPDYEKQPKETNDSIIEMQRVISELKDHINTLKEFLEEKNTVCELYKNEITRLKSELKSQEIS